AALRPDLPLTLEVLPKGEKKAKKVTAKVGEYQEGVPAKLPEKASLEKALQKGAAPKKEEPKKDDKKEDKKAEKNEKKADKEDEKDEKPKAPTGLLKRTNAARDRQYWVYVPEEYDPNVSHGLVIWLHPVNKNKKEDMEKITDAWADFCSDNKLIMVCPKSEHETGWVASEAEFVQESARAVIEGYTIDR